MTRGDEVRAFEQAFAEYVGAKYAIALCNGTATLHTALLALGVQPGDCVAVPPLTMASTTIAVLHAGAVPVFVDVDPRTWLIGDGIDGLHTVPNCAAFIAVSLYGLHQPHVGTALIDDAAQTLRRHSGAAFTSYSFQASKILALGEGGMLVTDDEAMATRAREYSSLGYRLRADQPRIDPAALKAPTYARHHRLGWNYRMNDLTAAEGLRQLEQAPRLLAARHVAARMYQEALRGCAWLTPQHVPDGWTHDYWAYPVAVSDVAVEHLADRIVAAGGERPYAAWRLTYQEPAFRPMAPDGTCPVAEDLQPRLLQFQTNDLPRAEQNAHALTHAIREIGG